MAITIITGKTGTTHVRSDRQRALNVARFSAAKCVYNKGLMFAYETISNNLIRIKNGQGINQGCEFMIDVNDYVEVTIENGLAGVKRNDLIVASYHKETASGIESVTLKVIKGTSATTPVDPTYTSGNILNGETDDDYPLYRVVLNGLNIESVTPLFNTAMDFMALVGAIAPDYTKQTYAVGDIRFYLGVLYKCNTAIPTAEAWTAGHWTTTTIAAEIVALNTNLAKKGVITKGVVTGSIVLSTSIQSLDNITLTPGSYLIHCRIDKTTFGVTYIDLFNTTSQTIIKQSDGDDSFTTNLTVATNTTIEFRAKGAGTFNRDSRFYDFYAVRLL